MNRLDAACWGLVATAVVLGAVLLAHVVQIGEHKAEADMVVSPGNLTMLTAQMDEDEEALFLLDNLTGRLLVYELNPGNQRIDLMAAADVDALFGEVRGVPYRR